MNEAAIVDLLAANPGEVWSVLMKSGQEIVCKMELNVPQYKTVNLLKPLAVRHIHYPIGDEQGRMELKTQPQMQRMCAFIPDDVYPTEMGQLWFMRPAVKKIADAYIQATTGLALARG